MVMYTLMLVQRGLLGLARPIGGEGRRNCKYACGDCAWTALINAVSDQSKYTVKVRVTCRYEPAISAPIAACELKK